VRSVLAPISARCAVPGTPLFLLATTLLACGIPRTQLSATPSFAASAASSGPCRDRYALRYEVTEDEELDHTLEVFTGPRTYAERRTHEDGAEVVLQRVGQSYGVRIDGAALFPASAAIRSEIATREQLFGARLGCQELRWRRRGGEAASRAEDARTITFELPIDARPPRSFDHLDVLGRLHVCERLRWREGEGRTFVRRGECRDATSRGRWSLPAAEHRFDLVDVERHAEPPEWLGDIPEPLSPERVVVPLEDPLRPRVRVRLGDGRSLDLIVDTGASRTVLDRNAAIEAGVAPLGVAPVYMHPPWLPAGLDEVWLADRVLLEDRFGLGARPVLVQDGLGQALDADGLLGLDVLGRLLLDVDGPAREVRFHPRSDLPALEAQQPETLLTVAPDLRTVRVAGSVAGVDEGLFLVDTGAAIDAVVTSTALVSAVPRRHGDPVANEHSEEPLPADYVIDIEGLHVGPYALPPTRAFGRYRDRELVTNGLGLVGMGTMRLFRTVFDLENDRMLMWSGDEYHVLRKYGVEVDDDDGVVLARVVPGPFAARGLRIGDELEEIAGVRADDAVHARRLLRGVRGGHVLLRVRRGARTRRLTVSTY